MYIEERKAAEKVTADKKEQKKKRQQKTTEQDEEKIYRKDRNMRQKKWFGTNSSFTQGCILAAALYFLLAGIFYYAAGEQLYERRSENEIPGAAWESPTPEVTKKQDIRQDFLCEMDILEHFTVAVCTFARENTGNLVIRLYDLSADRELFQESLRMEKLTDGQVLDCVLTQRADNVRGHVLCVTLTSDGTQGSAIAPWYAPSAVQEERQLYTGGQPTGGTLCFAAYGKDRVWTGPHYWQMVSVCGGLLCAGCIVLIYKKKHGKNSRIITMAYLYGKYRFLMRQLVSRDFKIKYKRSVLGALWSFVNPLLTMSVQYVVFSTLFKVDIVNYPVYLLSGIVLFNFFTESTNMSMYAITGNAGLITKVYVPKYIYPVSKTLSTGVNLLISLLPLFLMCLGTGVYPTRAWLLLPFVLACLLVFCTGLSFMLSAVMVFFRDIQFIWSVLTMVLTYATPVFYPETILSEEMKAALVWNPMYHFITFIRIVVLEGISPQPRLYLICALFSVTFFIIGMQAFRRLQDRFIFYL